MTSRKVCVVTGTRAEYGLLYPVLKEIERRKGLSLQLVATTAHLSGEFGFTYKQIEKDGFNIDDQIDNLLPLGTKSSIAKSTGLAIMLLADSFEKLNPDIVLLLGDRFETHAAATTALLMNIPISHIHGGEITEGAVDEQIRHSITKMSQLHFCSTEVYRQRIIQMGEDPSRVFNTGAPGIDNIVNLDLLSKDDLEKQLDWQFPQKCALFTYHPVTLENDDLKKDLSIIFNILANSSIGILFTYANADNGGRVINKKIESFCKLDADKYKVVKNLGQLRYLSAIKHVDLLIGNTSSGIIEAASFCKSVVNIGNRQSGRLKGVNVIDCNIEELEKSIELALSNDFIKKCCNQKNIYGDGKSAARIVNELINQPLSVMKKFIDIEL
jgi:UDP-N-acetylglucosamine 2-epimerase (non-hydrolysing)/GDP/UDP-N,N'-diacetylbacillosamine 2-epimerase (hydrolysing)